MTTGGIQFNAQVASAARTLASQVRVRATLTSSQAAALQPVLTAAQQAAAQMSDDEFWGWDRQYGTAVGVQAPTLRNLTKQGACGGGGCNPSFSTSQFWQANVACSPDVYSRVLFQSQRYLAAQARLQRLLASAPQAWVGQMYLSDTQDADGCSTRLPTRPAGQPALNTMASQWADWCIEVMRTVAVAHWASGVRWCEGDRVPGVWGGRGSRAPMRVWASPDAYDTATTRQILPSEYGTVAGALGVRPPIIDAAFNTAVAEANRYDPDRDSTQFGSYHPIGYFRSTSPRGSASARWTWGSRTAPLDVPKALRGVNEIGRSKLTAAAVFERFRSTDGRFPLTDIEFQGTAYPYYTGTWLQLSEVLATRNGNESGPHTWVMPEDKADFDPVVTPSLVQGSGYYWPDDLARPASSSPRDVLLALFQAVSTTPHGVIDQATLAELGSSWALHWSTTGWRFMPAALRQIWWCMALAYDVIDSSMGTVVAGAFGNFITGMNQIPPEYRVTDPTNAQQQAAAALQGNLDAIFAGCSAAAGVIAGIGSVVTTAGPVGAIIGAVFEVVAALVTLAGLLAQLAFSAGLARAGNPPVMPTVMVRVAGVASPTDACWIVPDTAGASDVAARASSIQAAASASEDPASWYAQVQAAIEAGVTPPPATPANVNKGVALGAGVAAGLALIKILGG